MENTTRFKQYISGCLVTWNHNNDPVGQLLNATLGLGGEAIEFLDTLELGYPHEKRSEAGDLLYYITIFWYVVVRRDTMREFANSTSEQIDQTTIRRVVEIFGLYTNFPHKVSLSEMQRGIGYILEAVKKYAFHGKELNGMKVIADASLIFGWLNTRLDELELTLEQVMDTNYNKLKERYPQGFAKVT